jgi:alpha-tubulin suppressor-like RCC1 family protein
MDNVNSKKSKLALAAFATLLLVGCGGGSSNSDSGSGTNPPPQPSPEFKITAAPPADMATSNHSGVSQAQFTVGLQPTEALPVGTAGPQTVTVTDISETCQSQLIEPTHLVFNSLDELKTLTLTAPNEACEHTLVFSGEKIAPLIKTVGVNKLVKSNGFKDDQSELTKTKFMPKGGGNVEVIIRPLQKADWLNISDQQSYLISTTEPGIRFPNASSCVFSVDDEKDCRIAVEVDPAVAEGEYSLAMKPTGEGYQIPLQYPELTLTIGKEEAFYIEPTPLSMSVPTTAPSVAQFDLQLRPGEVKEGLRRVIITEVSTACKEPVVISPSEVDLDIADNEPTAIELAMPAFPGEVCDRTLEFRAEGATTVSSTVTVVELIKENGFKESDGSLVATKTVPQSGRFVLVVRPSEWLNVSDDQNYTINTNHPDIKFPDGSSSFACEFKVGATDSCEVPVEVGPLVPAGAYQITTTANTEGHQIPVKNAELSLTVEQVPFYIEVLPLPDIATTNASGDSVTEFDLALKSGGTEQMSVLAPRSVMIREVSSSCGKSLGGLPREEKLDPTTGVPVSITLTAADQACEHELEFSAEGTSSVKRTLNVRELVNKNGFKGDNNELTATQTVTQGEDFEVVIQPEWLNIKQDQSYVLESSDPGIALDQTSCDFTAGEAQACVVSGRVDGVISAGTYTIKKTATASGYQIPLQYENLTLIVTGQVWQQVEAGDNHTCAINDKGHLYCWGANAQGQLGTGDTSSYHSPQPVKSLNLVQPFFAKALALGAQHSCAVALNDTLYCWGSNEQGQLGSGSSEPVLVPKLVPLPDYVEKMAVGANHSCAIAINERATFCWGDNLNGQVGIGTEGNYIPSPRVITAPSEKPFKDIALGHSHTCGVDEDGAGFCWGWNEYGQIGQNTFMTKTYPSPQSLKRGLPSDDPGRPLVSIYAGGHSVCALDTESDVWCWGDGRSGQLGREHPWLSDKHSQPASAFYGKKLSSVAIGTNHSCVVANDNQVYCTGNNEYGQLGNGTNTNSLSLVAVVGLPTSIQPMSLTAGGPHNCIIHDDKIRCWGNNLYGQLGDVVTIGDQSKVPVLVS